MTQYHCPSSASDCYAHTVQTFNGVAVGSFAAPDHKYPSYLELRLTATGSGGSDTESVRLDPQTLDLTLRSNPSGIQLTTGDTTAKAPFSRSIVVGSMISVSAPSQQRPRGKTYRFACWSDGGAQSHNIVAGARPTAYTAVYKATRR